MRERENGQRKRQTGRDGLKVSPQTETVSKKEIYIQTSIKRPLKGNVESGLLKRGSLKKGMRV